MTKLKLDSLALPFAIIVRKFPNGKLHLRLNASVLPRQRLKRRDVI
jgi:hypothetical protein